MPALPVPYVQPRSLHVPDDDVTVLDAWIDPEPGSLDVVGHFMYHLRLRLETGQTHEFFKAIRLLKVHRVPFQLRELTTLMEIHQDVLSGVWQSGINSITLIANILRPEPLGLLFYYGVQASGETAEEARTQVDAMYFAFSSALQGSYRQLMWGPLDKDEGESVLRLMGELRRMLVLRGIPKAKHAPGVSTQSTLFGGVVDKKMTEQLEEFVRALIDREFVYLVLTSPVPQSDLSRWLHQVSREEAKWVSQKEGTRSIAAGLSMPIMLMGNVGAATGQSQSTGHTDTSGSSVSHSEGRSTSEGLTETHSVTQGQSVAQGEHVSASRSVGHSEGIAASVQRSHSESITRGQTVGETEGIARSATVSESLGETRGLAHSQSETVTHGQSVSEQVSHSASHTRGESVTETEGISRSHGVQYAESYGESLGRSRNETVGTNESFAVGHSQSQSRSLTEQTSRGHTTGWNAGGAIGASGAIIRAGANVGYSEGDSVSRGTGYAIGYSEGQSVTNQVGRSQSISTGESVSASRSASYGKSFGESRSSSVSHGLSESVTEGVSRSRGVSESLSVGRTVGVTESESVSHTLGRSLGETVSRSVSRSVSESRTITEGIAVGQSRSAQVSENQGVSQGRSLSVVQSQSLGRSVSHSTTVGRSVSDTVGVSRGQADSLALSRTVNESQGLSGGMTVGAFLSLSKSYHWVDLPIENLAQLLEEQRKRLWHSLQGQGAHFVDAFVFVEDEPAKRAAAAAAKAAWYGDKLPTPFEVLYLSEEEEAHLKNHAQAFSPCYGRETIEGILEGYKYTTILLGQELSALTHPIRLEVGGPVTGVEDIPLLRVPSRMRGEIFHGYIVSADKWSPKTGFLTPHAFRIPKEALGHTLIAGQSRSGKTVGALRFVAEAANNVSYGSDSQGRPRRLSVVAFDWKDDWRVLKRVVDESRFRFYGMDGSISPLRMNLLRIPKGVDPQLWVDVVAEAFSLAYGLGTRGYSIIWQHLTQLYRQHNVFRYPERSAQVTLQDLWRSVYDTKQDMDSPNPKGGRVGNDVRDRYQAVLDRLVYYEEGKWVDMYCYTGPDGVTVEDLCAQDGRVTVLEAARMPAVQKTFIFGLMASAIWRYCQAQRGFDPGLLVIFEEAHEVIRGANTLQKGGGSNNININETVYETMYAEAMGLNLFLVTITQEPSKLPPSVIANCPLLYAYRMEIEDDVAAMIKKISRDGRYDHRDVTRWFTRQPTGWCVARYSRVSDFVDADPVIVQTQMLEVTKPTDEELSQFMQSRP